MNLQKICLGTLLFMAILSASADDFKLTSPDKNISLDIILKEKIYYSVTYKGEKVLEFSPLTLTIDNVILGSNPNVLKTNQTTIEETVSTVWGSRNEIQNHYNQLNGQYTVINPSGNTPDNQKVCTSLKALRDFMHSFNFIKMSPDKKFITEGIPDGTFYRGMSWPGNQYALYMHHSVCTKDSAAYTVVPGKYRHDLQMKLPKGKYKADWIDPANGQILRTDMINRKSGDLKLTTPVYSVDIALRITLLR